MIKFLIEKFKILFEKLEKLRKELGDALASLSFFDDDNARALSDEDVSAFSDDDALAFSDDENDEDALAFSDEEEEEGLTPPPMIRTDGVVLLNSLSRLPMIRH
jgi:hypothetical protein